VYRGGKSFFFLFFLGNLYVHLDTLNRPRNNRRPITFRNARSVAVSEGLLRGVDHVEEAVVVLLSAEELGHGHRDAGHAALVDQQEESLVRVQLHPAPENLDELGHGDVIGDEELGLVEQRQVLLSGKAFDDDGDFVGVQLPDQVGILNALL